VIERGQLRRLQEGARRLPCPWIKRLQGGDEVSEKTVGVIIVRFQRQPGYAGRGLLLIAQAMQPGGDQRGLAKPRRSGYQSQLPLQPLIQPLDQTRAGNPIGPHGRNIELGS